MKNNISIVISVFNENQSLQNCFKALNGMQYSLPNYSFNFIFVNDGSTDDSGKILQKLSMEHKNVTHIKLSRNYGHEAAMLAGIDYANADAIICTDADLQHPPEKIPEMIEKFEDGNDIVKMVRSNRNDGGLYKRITSSLFYSLLNVISPIQFDKNASDFFLISDRVANILKTDFRERTRFIRGILQCIGYNQTCITFEAPARKSGKTKYSFSKLMLLSIDAIASFSKLPLHLGLIVGIIFALFSLGVGVYSLIMKIIGETPPGYTTLVVFVSFAFAVQFILIGIIGVYIGYNFDESKKRPIYLIDKIE